MPGRRKNQTEVNMATERDSIFIDSFAGKGNEDFAVSWIAKFELYCKFKKLTDEQKLVSFPLRLSNQAFEWYTTLPEETRDDYTAFLTRYGPDKRVQFEQKKALWMKEQKQDQFVKEWAEEVQKCAIGLGLSAKDIMDIITAGIYQKSVKDAIIMKSPADLNELIEAATLMESANSNTEKDDKLMSVLDKLNSRLDGLSAEIKGISAVSDLTVNPVTQVSRPEQYKPSYMPQGYQQRGGYGNANGYVNRGRTRNLQTQGYQGNSQQLCYRCRGKHNPNSCWAKEHDCRTCGLIGHVSRACRNAQGARH